MWLRNFDLACAVTQLGAWLPSATGAVAGEDGYNLIHLRNGQWRDVTYSSSNTIIPMNLQYQGYMQSVSAAQTSSGFCFGTGTTPATYDDYNLESYLDGKFTYASATNTVTYDAESKKFVRTMVSDYRNTSGNTVTVTEIGEGGWVYLVGTYASILFMREVLASPVTVEADEYLRVTLKYEVGAYPNKPIVTVEATI